MTLACLLALNYLNAQISYTPFPESSGRWNLMYGDPTNFDNPVYGMNGDTIVAGKTYHKLYLQGACYRFQSLKYLSGKEGYVGAFRQDIVGKKIYLLLKDSTKEGLLYDFSNMVLGAKYPKTLYNIDTANTYLSKIDSFADDNSVKHFKYIYTDSVLSNDYIILQGIGFQGPYNAIIPIHV
jgi:hypothetical protein